MGNIPVGVMEDKTGKAGKCHPTLYAVLRTLPFILKAVGKQGRIIS